MTQISILLMAFFAANLPWFSQRLFYLFPVRGSNDKHLAWCLLELIILYLLVGLLAWYAEFSTFGQSMHQGWEFYAVTFCLFIVFSSPGFIYRMLWK
ncbi:MAG: DUF2818 family protein [Methylophilus sp.]|nr:DUF2818 family protein [Methylophilus sp.]